MSGKKSFFDSSMCKSGKNCEKCRISRDYREGISKVFDIPKIDFDCPSGKIEEEYKSIEFPKFFEMTKNLFKTGKDVVKHAKRNKRIKASSEAQKERLDTCKACNYYVRGRCKKCGCRLTAKIELEASRCPLRKWPSDK